MEDFDVAAFEQRLQTMVDDNFNLIQSGLLDEHDEQINDTTRAMMIYAGASDWTAFHGGARLLFVLGYRAGQAAPDLSVFSEALK